MKLYKELQGLENLQPTIRNADRILEIEDGRVAEIGAHSELITAYWRYKRLCTISSIR